DSERAANLALEGALDVGLHVNFTTPFSAGPSRLADHQQRVSRFLRAHRFAPVVFHPGLTASFEYLVSRQLDEYRRLYGKQAERIDGHHHMHLCANVTVRKLLPAGALVRRSFSFRRGDKGILNRAYRGLVDARLARRHRVVDYLFAVAPIEDARLSRVLSL